MASNVHTQEGTPPETTGPRGPRLSPAQAAALRLAENVGGLRHIETDDMIGSWPEPTRALGVFVSAGIGHRSVVAAPTVLSLLERGLMEQRDTALEKQRLVFVNDAGRAALEAGNIG